MMTFDVDSRGRGCARERPSIYAEAIGWSFSLMPLISHKLPMSGILQGRPEGGDDPIEQQMGISVRVPPMNQVSRGWRVDLE